MDEINFYAKRLDSLTEYEQGVLEAYAYGQGMEKMKDLINLTYSMQGLSLLTDFSNPVQVGRRLYMDKFSGISENEEQRINFGVYGLIRQGWRRRILSFSRNRFMSRWKNT